MLPGGDCRPSMVGIVVAWTNAAPLDVFGRAEPRYDISVRRSSEEIDVLTSVLPGGLIPSPPHYRYTYGSHRERITSDERLLSIGIRLHAEIRHFSLTNLLMTLSGGLVFVAAAATIVNFVARKVLPRKEQYEELLVQTSHDLNEEDEEQEDSSCDFSKLDEIEA
uniref:Uncharacterized protein n=1 Tax=Alexandrium monilatum TaxID=311494 RepID=A0A7S4W2F8_9DINO